MNGSLYYYQIKSNFPTMKYFNQSTFIVLFNQMKWIINNIKISLLWESSIIITSKINPRRIILHFIIIFINMNISTIEYINTLLNTWSFYLQNSKREERYHFFFDFLMGNDWNLIYFLLLFVFFFSFFEYFFCIFKSFFSKKKRKKVLNVLDKGHWIHEIKRF